MTQVSQVKFSPKHESVSVEITRTTDKEIKNQVPITVANVVTGDFGDTDELVLRDSTNEVLHRMPWKDVKKVVVSKFNH